MIETIGLIILVAWASYEVGRIGPDPMKPWEQVMRRRAFEWRIWWIEEQIRKAELRRGELVAWMKEGL